SWVHANRTAVIALHGTEAQAWSEADGARLFLARRGAAERTAVSLTPVDELVEALAEFARCVRDGAKPEVGGEEATANIAVLEAWPDFMTFYGTTATAAGIVVPKKYLEQVGDDGFRKHPIGAGPYKFVSHRPGVEVVLEAYTGYWRHVPYVKRQIMKSVPEGTTRVAMLKKGEADIAYALDGQEAEDVRRDPRLLLVATRHASIFWIEFADQWDPKSPWHDKRLRLAVNHALNRKAINEAA